MAICTKSAIHQIGEASEAAPALRFGSVSNYRSQLELEQELHKASKRTTPQSVYRLNPHQVEQVRSRSMEEAAKPTCSKADGLEKTV